MPKLSWEWYAWVQCACGILYLNVTFKHFLFCCIWLGFREDFLSLWWYLTDIRIVVYYLKEKYMSVFDCFHSLWKFMINFENAFNKSLLFKKCPSDVKGRYGKVWSTWNGISFLIYFQFFFDKFSYNLVFKEFTFS